MSAVTALELCEQAEAIVGTCSFIFDHSGDSDAADEVALALAALRDAKQAVAEAYSAVERHLLSIDTPKSFEVVGLGLVERKRGVKRSQWDHDAVRHELVKYASAQDVNPLDVIWEAMRPTWRTTALRGFGLSPDEYCAEEWGAETVVLPPRDFADRGQSVRTDDAA